VGGEGWARQGVTIDRKGEKGASSILEDCGRGRRVLGRKYPDKRLDGADASQVRLVFLCTRGAQIGEGELGGRR